MTDTILQSYLNNQIIRTAEQENIAKLKKAATEIENRLSKKKDKIISFTLVALDPNISETDPIVEEVERIIITKWSTFKNAVSTTKDKPINYIRAVILEALNGLAKNEDFATIIWHTGRNIISHYKITKKEQEVIEELLKGIGKKIEIASRSYWGIKDIPDTIGFEGTNINVQIGKVAKVNENQLIKELKAAAGYENWSMQIGGGENPSYPNNNSIQWSKFFSERAGKGMATVINKALIQQNKELSSISESVQTELNNYFSNLQPYFEQISTTLVQGVVANNKRSELLWWKQSLYSLSLNESYRKLTPLATVITMAVDLNNFVTPVYPVSVDYFLKEALKDVCGEGVDAQILLTDLLEEATELNQSVKAVIQSLAKDFEGRKTLGTAIANYLSVSGVDIFNETGIDKKAKISLAELSTWIFHDLQAAKLAAIK